MEDDGGDGLDFWFWAVVGQKVGTGNLSLRRQINPNFFLSVRNFNPDFGGDLYYDFIIPQAVNTEEELANARRLSVYPNPAQAFTNLELTGFNGEDLDWQLTDVNGKVLRSGQMTVVNDSEQVRVDTHNLAAGWYTLRVLAAGKQYVQEVVILPR